MNRFTLALLSITIPVSAARAQYPPPVYVNPYYPQGSPGYNYLNGQADVMRAQGDLYNATEKAHIEREKVKQARIDTKRKAFDEMMYEKANTPTYFEELSRDKQQYLIRIMNYPTKTEIHEGKSLNTMLPLLQDLVGVGAQGPTVTLPSFAVKALNVTSGGPGQSSIGMLGNKVPLQWPLGLRGPH